MISAETTVGQLASEFPLSTRTFARHGIDYCCGGKKRLAQVCEEKGLDAQALLNEVRKDITAPESSEVRWDQASPSDLIDHLIVTYHEPLREELPRLEAMLRKVVRVHGSKAPEMFEQLLSTYLDLKAELEPHMLKEEQILFPMLRGGRGAMAKGPISVMEYEHDQAGASLLKLRELTDDFVSPPGACNTWRALWAGLEALETELHRHIHLENNILFSGH